ncbi:MAG: hypothetical protein HOB32_10320 [Nitrospina sp.]|nr:hypothetical protein [Nitrospina sp.]MBT6602028.1 hypothetical protein [Nitrospina sp.]
MTKIIAFVRRPGSSFNQAISAKPKNQPINVKLACLQHDRYIVALEEANAEVVSLPAINEYPDAPFLEDTTVILDNTAVACPNKEKSRRGEGTSIHNKIKKYKPITTLPDSVTLDGGDVLNTEEKIFVGISDRTNMGAVDALAKLTKKPVVPIKVLLGLHLKTSVTYLGKNTLILNSSSIDTAALRGFKWIETGKANPYAANCLAIGNTVLMSKASNALADKIHRRGFKVLELDISEFEKADGGITCLSIILNES